MLVRPAHSAVLAVCLRNLGWRPVKELSGQPEPGSGAQPPLMVPVPVHAVAPGSHLKDSGLWEWWVVADGAVWEQAEIPGETPHERLFRVLSITLGDSGLAQFILEHGTLWAPRAPVLPIKAGMEKGRGSGAGRGRVALGPAALASPVKD